LIAAASFLQEHHAAPEILIGHSLGGSAVIAAARRLPETKSVATINAPADPAVIRDLIRESVPEIEQKGEAEVQIGCTTFRIRNQFLEDIAAQKLLVATAEMNAAFLVLHSPDDEIVPIENASQIFEAAKHPKSIVALDEADHLLTREADALYAGRVLAAWASRYIRESEEASATEGTEPRYVFVTETGEGKYANIVQTGAHIMRADEPASVGGDDTGPNPYEYLLAGLGACTTMTLRMYADRNGWPLEKVRVRLRHEKIHADDCENCETQEGKIDQIEREIELSGPLDDAQRARIMEIADKCPVHRTLHSEVEIVTLEGIA
jgi:putative redox protein